MSARTLSVVKRLPIALIMLASLVLMVAAPASASGSAPDLNAGADRTVDEDTAVDFNGTASDPEGDTLTLSWELPGGHFVDGANVQYTFENPGDFTVRFWANDGTSNVSDGVAVTVLDITPPTAAVVGGNTQSVEEDSSLTLEGTDSTDNAEVVNWTWDVEEAAESLALYGDTVSHTWATPGLYVVTLSARDAAGNVGTVDVTVTVLDITSPVAAFSVTAPSNEDTALTFDGLGSTDNVAVASWDWLFEEEAGNSTDSGSVVSHSWAEPGLYSVLLTVADAAGHTADRTVVVNVLDVTPPTAYFEIVSPFGNVAQTLDGTDAEDNVGVVNWTWTLEDYALTETCFGDLVTYTWATPGTFDITLTVADAAGNTGALTRTVTVTDTMAPAVEAGTDRTVNEDTAVGFDGTATSDNDPAFPTGASFVWTFSDGGTVTLTGATASYSFATPGDFVVTLTVTDAALNAASAAFTVRVVDVTPPTAAFDLSSSVNEDALITLDAAPSSDNVGVVGWAWTVGDSAGDSTATTESLTHTWATPGTYEVALTVSDAAGNSASLTRNVTVLDVTPPSAVMALASAFDEDTEQTLDGSQSTDNVGVASFAWAIEEWGSTVTRSGASITYTWNMPRTYTVTLTVTDAAGNGDTVSQTVTVRDVSPPSASISVAAAFSEDTSQTLDGSASGDNLAVVDWTWTLEDAGGPHTRTGEVATYTWTTPGTFNVTLTVSDAAGNTGTASASVVVADVTPPTPVIQVPARVYEGQSQALSGSGSTDNVGVVSYAWVVEDSTGSHSYAGAALAFTWDVAGAFSLSLTVTDAAGNADTAQRTVTVREATPPTAVISLAATFDEDTSQSLDGSGSTDNVGVVSWTWTVEDAGFSRELSGATVSYSWATPGTYVVTLAVLDAAENRATSQVSVVVRDVTSPTASFDLTSPFGNTAQTLDGSPSFDNVGVVSWAWTISDYGGTATRSGATATYTWNTPGTYDVTLTVADAAGLTGAKTVTVRVLDTTAPAARAGDDRAVGQHTAVSFDGTASTDNDPLFPTGATFAWSFDEGSTTTTVTGSTVSFTWATAGVWYATLRVTDAAGNSAEDSVRVTVLDLTPPQVAFDLPAAVPEDSERTLDGSASTDNVGVVSWAWTIEDAGFTATLLGRTATYTWTTPGTFAVTLAVADAAGNTASKTASVIVVDTTAPSIVVADGLSGPEDAPITLDASATTDNSLDFAATGRFMWFFAEGTGSRSLAGPSVAYTFATPGEFFVTLVVVDGSGNLASTQLKVTVLDRTAPTAAIAGGSAQAVDEDKVVLFDASPSTDNTASFLTSGTFAWTINDGGPVGHVGVRVTHIFATPGQYLVTLRASDPAGNFATATLLLTVRDVTAPTAAMSLPASVDEDVAQALDGTSSADNVGISSWTWTVEDTTGTVTLTGAAPLYTWATPGVYRVTLTVVDAAGLVATNAAELRVFDTTPPEGVATVPATAAPGSSILFSAAAVGDNDPAFASTRNDVWTLNEGGMWVVLVGTTVPYTFHVPGTYTVQLRVQDAGGNTLDRVFTVAVPDTAAPWMTLLTPAAGALVNTPFVEVSGAVELGTALRVNGELVATTSGAFAAMVPLTEGDNTITLVARDEAGNEAVKTIHVRLDTAAPVLDLTAPADGSTTTAGTVTVTGWVREAGASLSVAGATAEVRADGSFSAAVALLEGRNVFTLRATDAAGNVRAVTLAVMRDSTAPALAAGVEGATDGAGGLTSNGPSVVVRGSAEPGSLVRVWTESTPSGLLYAEVRAAGDGSFAATVPLPDPGTTTIRVQAADAAGNSATTSFSVVRGALSAPPVETVGPWMLATIVLALAFAAAASLAVVERRRRGRLK